MSRCNFAHFSLSLLFKSVNLIKITVYLLRRQGTELLASSSLFHLNLGAVPILAEFACVEKCGVLPPHSACRATGESAASKPSIPSPIPSRETLPRVAARGTFPPGAKRRAWLICTACASQRKRTSYRTGATASAVVLLQMRVPVLASRKPPIHPPVHACTALAR